MSAAEVLAQLEATKRGRSDFHLGHYINPFDAETQPDLRLSWFIGYDTAHRIAKAARQNATTRLIERQVA